MNNITPALAAKLKDYVNKEQPLGPINAAQIYDKEVGNTLFERDNKLHQEMKRNPSIIVGRRGSGKTAYLNGLHYDKQYAYVIPFKTLKPFEAIVQGIQANSAPSTLVESVAEQWRCALLTMIFAEVLRRNEAARGTLTKTGNYLHKIGVRLPIDNKSAGASETIWQIANTLSRRQISKETAETAHATEVFGSPTFEDADEEITSYLLHRKERAIVLIDSLDDYPLADASANRAISGLLKCVGMFNRPDRPYHVRFCLPAELYPEFVKLSSNPSKDFEREILLNWHSRELLYVIAQRIKLYYCLYDREVYQKIREIPYDNRTDARTIVHTCLPERIQNAYGRMEATLTYLFRHTQLLPRQALELLNNVLKRAFEGDKIVWPLAESYVVDGIAQIERRLAMQIFSAFNFRHQTAQDVCERCIPELESVFTVQELEAVFRRYGRPAFGYDDHHEFRKMLIETGVLGVVNDETGTDEYIEGVFEYSAPQQLPVGHSDMFCIHPIFSGVFRCKKPADLNRLKPIYPYGTDVNTKDVRVFRN